MRRTGAQTTGEKPACSTRWHASLHPLLQWQLTRAESWGGSWALHPVPGWQDTEAARLPGRASAAHFSTKESQLRWKPSPLPDSQMVLNTQ